MVGPDLPAFSKIAGIYVHFFIFYLYYIGNVDISFIFNWRLFAKISSYMYLYYQYQFFCKLPTNNCWHTLITTIHKTRQYKVRF